MSRLLPMHINHVKLYWVIYLFILSSYGFLSPQEPQALQQTQHITVLALPFDGAETISTP